MRGRWNGLLCLIFLIAFLGCRSREPYLRPPKAQESFATVPDDPRYQNPPNYPAEALAKNRDKAKDAADPSGNAGFKGPRAGVQ